MGLMVDISIVNGGYKLTYNWGEPHCISFKWWIFRCPGTDSASPHKGRCWNGPQQPLGQQSANLRRTALKQRRRPQIMTAPPWWFNMVTGEMVVFVRSWWFDGTSPPGNSYFAIEMDKHCPFSLLIYLWTIVIFHIVVLVCQRIIRRTWE